MNSWKNYALKNNKFGRINNRLNYIHNILGMDEDDYTTEKRVTINGEEYHPWCMYVSEKTANVENYPEYSYFEFSLYIYDSLIDPIFYAEIFHIFRLADPGDIVHIYINSPGGDISTLCSFSAAIEETKAAVITHIDGSADSAAFVLAFMGDEIELSEFAQMMSHNVSMSTSRTNMANLEKYAKNTKIMYKGMLEKYCYRILTQEEINSICENGTEIHLSSKECEERLKKWEESEKSENDDLKNTENNDENDESKEIINSQDVNKDLQ